MAIFPAQAFVTDSIPLRRGAFYTSSEIGRKSLGPPKGVYVGFLPVAGANTVTLGVDPVEGYSMLKVPSLGDDAGMDIIVSAPIVLDFTGQPPGDFPIHVVAVADYTVGVPTTASIITRSVAAVAHNECLICTVDGPVGALAVRFDGSTAPPERDIPLAYATRTFGLMPAGSVEDLAAVALIVNEVLAARIDLDSVVHASLSDRIAADLTPASIARRLSLSARTLASNIYTAPSGSLSLNVSGSFSANDRDFAPLLTFDGEGTETTEGAITAPTDTVRNICVMLNANTGKRIVSTTPGQFPVYGRITKSTDALISGTLQFHNAAQLVTGVDTVFTGDLQNGDLIYGADGEFYQVLLIASDTQLLLKSAYGGATTTSSGLIRRRFTLTFFSLQGGAELPYQFPSQTTIQFFFPVWMTQASSVYQAHLLQFKPGNSPDVDNATTSTPGKILLADVNCKVGGIKLQNANQYLKVGGGLTADPLQAELFHTLNFTKGGGAVIESPTGAVFVGAIGDKGPTGDPGLTGPQGDPGGRGAGYNAKTPWKTGGAVVVPGGATTPVSISGEDMGHEVHFIAGGIAMYQGLDAWPFFTYLAGDSFKITGISSSGNLGTITAQVVRARPGGGANVKLYLSSAGSV